MNIVEGACVGVAMKGILELIILGANDIVGPRPHHIGGRVGRNSACHRFWAVGVT
jgi:hypothetical protein